MKAMILAAGRGQRLRPLTDTCPKPLIQVGGKALIEYHLYALAAAGFSEVVINAAWLAGQLQTYLGDGSAYGLRLHYSVEVPGQLDTGGGIKAALPLLGAEPFVVISADAFTDYDLSQLQRPADAQGCYLVLVDNPPHHPEGDFGLAQGVITQKAPRYTYGGIGVFQPQAFEQVAARQFSLAQIIRSAVAAGQAKGEHYRGCWLDVGRPATLKQAREWVG